MRGHQGPCLAIGNYPAARRRRPPPIIQWSIGIITCLLFIGAAAMLTVGYLNPFGTVGLAILGVGAVVYFGAILFLVLSCLWVERKYPGMQPLSFKIYARKPNRMPPTTFANPNISGQMPVDTTPNYRMHNELPIQVPGLNDEGGTTDKSQEKKYNNSPSHGSSPGNAKNPKTQSTVLNTLEEEDHNGGISDDDNRDIRYQAQTNNDNISVNEDPRDNLISTAEKGERDIDQNKSIQHKQSENDNNVSVSRKKEKKVQFKTHHIEVPFADYAISDSSASSVSNKDKSQDIQVSNPSTENENSTTTGASEYPSSTKTSTIDKQTEASSSVNNLSHASDDFPHQRTKTAALSAVNAKDVKQETFNTHKSRFNEKDEKLQDGPQSTLSSQPVRSSPVHARTQIYGIKHQNYQENSQRVRGLTSTNSASPPAARKLIERESHASKPTHAVSKDSALTSKSSPVSARKLLDVHKNNATNPDQAQESVQERSQSSPLNMNFKHDQQNMTSLKQRTQNSGSPGGSPTRALKQQSPERARNIRKGDAVLNSPPANRKAESSSSPPRHHQNRTDNFSKAQRTQEQSITIQTFSSSGRREEIQKKKILHSSQSNDFPSSSSSSPPRQHQRSPNRSPRLPRNMDHISRTTSFHSSPRNEEFSNIQSHHASPSSSTDVPASSSSPRRTRKKSPDLSSTVQRQDDIPVTNVLLSSNNKKDELHKKA